MNHLTNTELLRRLEVEPDNTAAQYEALARFPALVRQETVRVQELEDGLDKAEAEVARLCRWTDN